MIKTEIYVKTTYSTEDIKARICAHIPVKAEELSEIQVLRKQLKITDAGAGYSLQVAFSLPEERERGLLKMKKKVSEYLYPSFAAPSYQGELPPIVVGAGPAGLFAALTLAEAGAQPIVLERGEAVEDRQRTVNAFMSGGPIVTESNVQFGEGGAGAFSDGKLKVGSMDKYKMKVLSEFVEMGADEDIVYTVGAHLGTDRLPSIVKAIRNKIISLGGSFIFGAKLYDYREWENKITALYEKDGERLELDGECIILATGHSARDTFRLLYKKGVPMESRGFGIGARIEHKREYINKLIYKNLPGTESLGTASYHLVSHLDNGRSVYSFCMCPGGEVVAAASEECGIVTNGMSKFSRMDENSNSAVLVSVTPEDFGFDSPLGGIMLAEEIERRAYSFSDSYHAPATAMKDFISGNEASSDFRVTPSYKPGVVKANLDKILPHYITDSIREGLFDFDKWLPGFLTEDSILTAPETRSTSPVRILRNDNYTTPVSSRIYPIGEGAGYAGGIVSSAVDGVRCAERILFMNE